MGRYTKALLINLYWRYRMGLCTADEWIQESGRVLREGLADQMHIHYVQVWNGGK